jgi:hypothetical protein
MGHAANLAIIGRSTPSCQSNEKQAGEALSLESGSSHLAARTPAPLKNICLGSAVRFGFEQFMRPIYQQLQIGISALVPSPGPDHDYDQGLIEDRI